MKILASLPAKTIIHAGVIEILSTILLCYVLAVVNGHVPVWLPMISDCAVYAPEKYPFRLGIVVGACLIAVQVVTTYYANRDLKFAKALLVLGVVGSAGLGVVGVVNEVEDDNVHDFSAVTFFVCYDIYMLLTLYDSWFKEDVSIYSYFMKCVFAVVGSIAGIGYVAGKYFMIISSIYMAILEWTNTFAAMFFVWTAVLDEMKNCNISEIAEDASECNQKKPIVYTMKEPPMKPIVA